MKFIMITYWSFGDWEQFNVPSNTKCSLVDSKESQSRIFPVNEIECIRYLKAHELCLFQLRRNRTAAPMKWATNYALH